MKQKPPLGGPCLPFGRVDEVRAPTPFLQIDLLGDLPEGEPALLVAPVLTKVADTLLDLVVAGAGRLHEVRGLTHTPSDFSSSVL